MLPLRKDGTRPWPEETERNTRPGSLLEVPGEGYDFLSAKSCFFLFNSPTLHKSLQILYGKQTTWYQNRQEKNSSALLKVSQRSIQGAQTLGLVFILCWTP